VTRGGGRQSNLVRVSGVPVGCGRDNLSGASSPPRCSVARLWQRAKQLGAPDPGYAKITASIVDGSWQWQFRIAGHAELVITDDC
jgi:hypothetical protein